MNIDDAALATRKHKVEWMAFDNGSVIELFSSDSPDNQAACDRLNLLAVLEAIREPSGTMVNTGYYSSLGQREISNHDLCADRGGGEVTDLREKISDLLHEWRSDIIDETVAYDWGCHAKKPASTYDIADRILALLPKVPELRWDGTKLRSGEVCLGKVVYSRYVSEWGLYDMMGRSLGWRATEPEARAAVEAAVRKALGWAE